MTIDTHIFETRVILVEQRKAHTLTHTSIKTREAAMMEKSIAYKNVNNTYILVPYSIIYKTFSAYLQRKQCAILHMDSPAIALWVYGRE